MTDSETLDEPVPLRTLIKRINRVFEDELHDPRENVDFHLILDEWDPGDGTRWRVRISYVHLEDGSGVSDLGPVFTSERELRAFLRGLELGGDGSVAVKAAVT